MSDSPFKVAGRYVNLDGSVIPPKGMLRRGLKWKLGRERDPHRLPDALDTPAAPVEPDAGHLAEPPHPMQVTWLGHATALIQLDGQTLITDPTFATVGAGAVKRLAPAPLAIEALPPIDGILVSHNHYDHLDLPALRALRRRFEAAPVYVPSGLGGWMRRKLGEPVVELAWWGAAEQGAVRVWAVPAHHWSARLLVDARRSHWCGFVVEGEAGRVYFAGDTGAGPHFAAIAERFDIDAALLPIGAYSPRWFMKSQHMNPEDAVEAAATLGAHLLPIHWGTYKLTDEPLDEPPRWTAQLAGEAGVPLTLLWPGGRWTPTGHDGGWRWPGADAEEGAV